MREVVRDGHALGLFAEGTRQLEAFQPRAAGAMAALQEDVPVVPAAIHGSFEWKVGNWHPIAVAWGEPLRFNDGLPKGAKGCREVGVGRDRAADPASTTGSPRSPRSAGRAGRRRHDEPETAPEIIGTVAIVGFPNVGKSTLIAGLSRRQAVVHETPGVTRDRKELLADWNGKHFLLVDTGGVDDLATDPFSPSIARQARAAIEETGLVLFVVDARHGITPRDEELATTLRASSKPGARAREQDRRSAPRPRRGRVPQARPRRPDPALRPARSRHRRPARRDHQRGCRARRGRRSATRRSASPSSAAPTSASRRS